MDPNDADWYDITPEDEEKLIEKLINGQDMGRDDEEGVEVDATHGAKLSENVQTDFPDYSSAFVRDVPFRSRREVVDWVQGVGRSQMHVIITYKSDYGRGKQKRRERVTLACERSGVFRTNTKIKGEPKYISGTRKCQCPFKLYAKDTGHQWILQVKCGSHNHRAYDSLEGHPYPGRPTKEEHDTIVRLTQRGVKPMQIFNALKDENPNNCTTLKQVKNIQCKYRRSVRHPRTQMQHILKLLVAHSYEFDYLKDEATNELKAVFWAHLSGIALFHSFSIVLVMDSTYKTNRYRYPLLEIVGQTSTDKTFSVAFCFMDAEKESNFTWALRKLRALIHSDDAIPQVIVTDKETAIVNAVEHVFPTSAHLLCQFHIFKNVKDKVSKSLSKENVKKVNPIMKLWTGFSNTGVSAKEIISCMASKFICLSAIIGCAICEIDLIRRSRILCKFKLQYNHQNDVKETQIKLKIPNMH